MNRNEEMYYEPLCILEHLSEYGKAEMTEEGLAFLCGLIRVNRPHKIVEIGVAAGGTTAVIMNCIAMLGLQTRIYSVDLMERYYLDPTKEVGYLAQEFIAMHDLDTEHILYTGKYAVECLEEIGEDIDFLILDTVHNPPGEVLDFLSCYPCLKSESTVVLHDITLNHCGSNPYAHATKLLFDIVTANKIINWEINNHYPDIAAFVVNEHTGQYIENLFSCLTLAWEYMPKSRELSLYREWYSRYYSSDCLDLFDIAVKMNQVTLEKRPHVKWEGFLELYRSMQQMQSKRIYVYGCGRMGRQFFYMLKECGIELGGCIISDGQEKIDDDFPIFYISDIRLDRERDKVFVAVNSVLRREICADLEKRGIDDYILPAKMMYEFLA